MMRGEGGRMSKGGEGGRMIKGEGEGLRDEQMSELAGRSSKTYCLSPPSHPMSVKAKWKLPRLVTDLRKTRAMSTRPWSVAVPTPHGNGR